MGPRELNEFINKLNVDAENLEEYLMDIALYSEGTIQYSDLKQMPMARVRLFEKRLSDYLKKKSGKKGTEYL